MPEVKEIISKDAIMGIVSTDKAIQSTDKSLQNLIKTIEENNKVLNENKVSVDTLNKARENTVKTNKDIDTVGKQLANTEQKLKSLEDKRTKTIIKNQQALRDQKKEIQANIVLENKEAGTIEKLTAQNKKLITERSKLNLETTKGRKRLKEINDTLNKNNAFIKDNLDNLGKQKMSVGGYTEAIKGSLEQSGLLSNQLSILNRIQAVYNTLVQKSKKATEAETTAKVASTTATSLGTKALRIFKVALISTGIGAIVVALGSLVVFLTRTQEGFEKVTKVLNQVGAFFDVIIDRIARLGKGFFKWITGSKEGLDEMKDSFKGVNEEIEKEVKLSGELTKARFDLARAENDLIVTNAKRKRQIQELILLTRDEKVSFEERMKALKEANQIELDQLKDSEKIQKDRVANVLGVLNITQEQIDKIVEQGLKLEDVGISISKEEDRKEALEEIAKLYELQTQSLSRQRELLNRVNELQNKWNATIEKTKDRTGEVVNKMLEEFEKIDDAIEEVDLGELFADFDKENDEFIKTIDATSEAIERTRDRAINARILAAREGARSEEEFAARVMEINTRVLEDEVATLQRRLENKKLTDAERILLEQDLLDRQLELKLSQVEQEELLEERRRNAKYMTLAAVKEIFGQESAIGKAATAFQRAEAIKQNLISLGVITTKSAEAQAKSAAAAPFPFNIPLILGTIAQFVSIISLFKSAPKFKEGTKGKYNTPDTFWTSEKGAGIEWVEKAGKIIETTEPTLHTGSKNARVYSNQEVRKIKEHGGRTLNLGSLSSVIKLGNKDIVKEIRNIPQPIISDGKQVGFIKGTYIEKWL